MSFAIENGIEIHILFEHDIMNNQDKRNAYIIELT